MKKIVRLTESDLTRLVKRVIKEQEEEEFPTYMEDMKQTAVEWLINIIDQKDWVNYTTEERLEVFRFAKEMENEQQGYSETEVLQLLLRLQQTESYNNLYDWFEQFKKK
jgi:hypothetical protein